MNPPPGVFSNLTYECLSGLPLFMSDLKVDEKAGSNNSPKVKLLIEGLPLEILIKIVSYIDVKDLVLNLKSTNHFMKELVIDNKVWLPRHSQRFDFIAISTNTTRGVMNSFIQQSQVPCSVCHVPLGGVRTGQPHLHKDPHECKKCAAVMCSKCQCSCSCLKCDLPIPVRQRALAKQCEYCKGLVHHEDDDHENCSYYVRQCDSKGCSIAVCDSCQYRNHSVGYCQICITMYCDNCGHTSICDDCGGEFCDECKCVYYCDGCDKSSCSQGDCTSVLTCLRCDRTECEDCVPSASMTSHKTCDTCSNTFCWSCVYESESMLYTTCSECLNFFCETCQDSKNCLEICDVCQEPICTMCGGVQRCHACRENICPGCLPNQWTSHTLCEDCQDEQLDSRAVTSAVIARPAKSA